MHSNCRLCYCYYLVFLIISDAYENPWITLPRRRLLDKIPSSAPKFLDKTYAKTYYLEMGLPKVTKQTDLRDNLYKTLEEIATGGSPHLVPTKNGEVIILSRKEYDKILFEKDLLQEFQEPIKFGELNEAETVIAKLDKKFGFKK